MIEEWKDIDGYEGIYQISNFGDVKNIKTNKILIGDINNAGYKRVCLYYKNKKKYFIHKLVANHFVYGKGENLVINHIDGNKLNNKANNLEWCTRSENDLHAFKLNLRTPNIRKPIYNIISTNIETREQLIFSSVKECSEYFNISKSNIVNCCNNHQNTAKGHIFKYIPKNEFGKYLDN